MTISRRHARRAAGPDHGLGRVRHREDLAERAGANRDAFAADEAARLFPTPSSTGDVSAASLLAARERLARGIQELSGAVPSP